MLNISGCGELLNKRLNNKTSKDMYHVGIQPAGI